MEHGNCGNNYNRKYNEAFHPQDFIRLSQLGKDATSICRMWGISYNTLFSWRKRHPEFKAALLAGRQDYKEFMQKNS